MTIPLAEIDTGSLHDEEVVITHTSPTVALSRSDVGVLLAAFLHFVRRDARIEEQHRWLMAEARAPATRSIRRAVFPW